MLANNREPLFSYREISQLLNFKNWVEKQMAKSMNSPNIMAFNFYKERDVTSLVMVVDSFPFLLWAAFILI